MSKQNNLKDFLKDVADTIREKKGTDDLINPQDFSNEIANMSGSGADGGDILYFSDGTTTASFCDTTSGISVCGDTIITDTSNLSSFLLKGDNGEYYASTRYNVALNVGIVKNPCKSGEFKVKWYQGDSLYKEETIIEVPLGEDFDSWGTNKVVDTVYYGLGDGVTKAIVTYGDKEYIFNFEKI